MSVLTRTIKKHRNFVGRGAHYSETPGVVQWDTGPGQARAAFYSCTAAHVIARAHGGFRSRRFDDSKTNSMLQMAKGIMTEVNAMVTADRLTGTDLRVAVARTHMKIRGVMKIVELSQRRDAEDVRKGMIRKRESLREFCRGVTIPGRTCNGDGADGTGMHALPPRQPCNMGERTRRRASSAKEEATAPTPAPPQDQNDSGPARVEGCYL